MQSTAAHEPRLIMIVDDDPVLRDFVSLALDDQGYRTITAGDGALALALLETELPALILTDAGMPALGGHEFAARVREQWGDGVPLVIMSGSRPSHADHRDTAVSAYLPKPFELEELFSLIKRYVCAAPAVSNK